MGEGAEDVGFAEGEEVGVCCWGGEQGDFEGGATEAGEKDGEGVGVGAGDAFVFVVVGGLGESVWWGVGG